MSPLLQGAIAVLEAAEPAVQRALVQTIHNVNEHEDPLSAAETAVVCTAARQSSLEIVKAALRLKKKRRG